MNRILSLAALGALAAGLGLAQEPAPAPAPAVTSTDTAVKKTTRIQNRKNRQQGRIADGVQSGELTAAEAARLEKREAKLNQQIREDRKDGGGMTRKERAKIEARQDAISGSIAKQKHDKQDQNKK